MFYSIEDGQKEILKKTVLPEDKLDDTGTWSEASPKKSLHLSAFQCGLAKVQLMLVQSC
jgi:hypothetical protein